MMSHTVYQLVSDTDESHFSETFQYTLFTFTFVMKRLDQGHLHSKQEFSGLTYPS